MTQNFWRGRRVLVTGHTGFKGSWLSAMLSGLGARVSGYALAPDTEPNLYDLMGGGARFEESVFSDIRDRAAVVACLERCRPEIIFHLAAQPLVRESYQDPVTTYETNVLGTVYLLEAVRSAKSVKAVVNVTTDKCYENLEIGLPFKETDPLGGYDPYSNSKACSELVTSAYRNSFFTGEGVGLASARAGNVVGGGDWSKDRLIPDCIRSIQNRSDISLRSPHAVRPWQHVLDVCRGYLLLGERVLGDPGKWSGPFNFGPRTGELYTVEQVVRHFVRAFEAENSSYASKVTVAAGEHPHEARLLQLDSDKARTTLGWDSLLDLESTVNLTAEWYAAYLARPSEIAAFTETQIKSFLLRSK